MAIDPTTPGLGRVGFWRRGTLLTPEQATAAERAGYGALWLGGSPPADLATSEALLDATEHITIATGIVNIWTAPAAEVAASFHRIEERHPGRFVLGIGVGHPEAQAQYTKPHAAMVAYLDILDAEGVPAARRIISALGPRMLGLAAARSAGTHPYLTTPVHTRYARDLVGESVVIAPEQRFLPDEDIDSARATGRTFLARYLAMSNYRRMLGNHGFTDADLDDGATDAAVDALTPHGSVTDLAAAVRGHLDAGADHVTVQILPAQLDPVPVLESLARELDLG